MAIFWAKKDILKCKILLLNASKIRTLYLLVSINALQTFYKYLILLTYTNDINNINTKFKLKKKHLKKTIKPSLYTQDTAKKCTNST